VGQSNQLTANAVQFSENDDMQFIVPMTEQPLAMRCFHVDDYPLLGLVYANYVDIIDPLKPEVPFKSLLTTYPLQILNSGSLAYATPSRVQVLNLHDGSELTIKEGLSDLQKWHLEYNRLVWNNSFHRFYETLQTESVIKYGEPNYLFGSEVKVLANGSFMTSEGLANNKIVLRNKHAKVAQEWLLDEPIIMLSHSDNSLLVATMSLNSNNAYTLWCLTMNQAVRKLVLADNISQIMCINGLAFWLADKQTLNYCNTALQAKILTTFTTDVLGFAVCYDHRFIVINYKDDKNRLFLTILKNRVAL
jgi:hypothetical protein